MSDRRNDPEYRKWVNAVKAKTGGRCAICGAIDGVVAHHIIPYSIDKDNRMNVNNGILLCAKHHKMAHLASDICHKGRMKASKIYDNEILDDIIGMYFHTLDEDKFMHEQGRIIGRVDDFYIIQFFEWCTGIESTIGTKYVYDFLREGMVNLYRTSDAMKYWYEYKARKDFGNRDKIKNKEHNNEHFRFYSGAEILNMEKYE